MDALMTEVNGSVNVSMSIPHQDCSYSQESIVIKAIKTIAYSVVLFLSVLGNSLVVAVIYRNHRLRTIVNFFILNMSVSDLLMPLSAHTLLIQDIYFPEGRRWLVDGVFGSISCKALPFVSDLSVVVSVLSLELIAIERFCAIVYPMKRQPIRSKKACFICIVLIWLFGAISSSSYLYSWQLIHFDTIPYCVYSWEPAFDTAQMYKIDSSVSLIIFTILPFLFLTSLYSAIIISLHRQKANIHLAPEQMQLRSRKYRRITYMLATVVIVFLVTWTPLNIYIFLSVFLWTPSYHQCESKHLYFIAMLFSVSYPAVNPFIYYIFNEDYRKGFQELLSCFRGRRLRRNNQTACSSNISNITYDVRSGPSKAVVLSSLRPLGMEA